MEAEDLVFQMQMNGEAGNEVVIVIDGVDHKLTGTVIGDSGLGETYIYAEKK